MAIPLIYNVRSVSARWTSTIVAVAGIAGTVGVFIAMLSLAHGFKATLVSSGSADNALITRAGATSEITSGVSIDSVKVIQDAPGIARGAEGPLVSPEAVLMVPIPLRSTGTDANVMFRGVSPNVLAIRKNVKIIEGRMLRHGLTEIVVGKNAKATYSGLTLGSNLKLGSANWQVVGIFDAGGSAFDSEVWGDPHLINGAYNRPDTLSQSVTVHLTSPAAFQKLKDSLTGDPRLNVDVTREIDYYAKQSTRMTTLITRLGGFVALIMAIGAVFGALNTMYSAVAERGREIATMRALGFTTLNVLVSFLFEALFISLIGGILGCLAVLWLDGRTASTMNFQTFSNLAFAFKITYDLLLMGILFALVMGVLGGLLPAIRAAVRPVAVALREL
ncbi:MAG TPA: FtsX-like permease family protein [Candidatus Acidoferrum sp.]|jgi:putative ABC transport system permease protein|nr:FtsX-like permease family protein [Candidatus Acidoferrum sp.]